MINHSKEILKHTIIYFVSQTEYCGVTKLVKLLFFLDFTHYATTGVSWTGLQYKAYEHGPYPEEVGLAIRDFKSSVTNFLDIEKKDNFTKITPKIECDTEYFSNYSKNIMDDLIFIYKQAKANDIVEISHNRLGPWDKVWKNGEGEFEIIDYKLSLEGFELTSNLKPLNKEEIDDVETNLQEMREIFG